MRSILAACLFIGLAGCQQPGVVSDSRPVAEILAADGLAAADAALTGRPQSPEVAFQLGGVRFLRAFEVMMQTRYQTYQGDVGFLPGMQVELPPNPNAKFDPAFVETAFKGALTHLAGAEKALGPALAGEFTVSLPLSAIWMDIDRDGKRAEWESLFSLISGLGAVTAPDQFDGTVKFDTADAEWLAAYVQMISGVSELVLSLDPTPAIRTISEGRDQLAKAGAIGAPDPLFGTDDLIDQIAAVLMTLEGEPDAARTRKALAHFSSMIGYNRQFWPAVMAETDNDHEWLPNPSQTSAFGVKVDRETAANWQAVLAELNDMLAGRTLIPYWRTPYGMNTENRGVGVNLKKFLTDPPDMDAVLLIQGAAVAPYLETGPLVTLSAFNRFMAMTQNDGLLLALMLN